MVFSVKFYVNLVNSWALLTVDLVIDAKNFQNCSCVLIVVSFSDLGLLKVLFRESLFLSALTHHYHSGDLKV